MQITDLKTRGIISQESGEKDFCITTPDGDEFYAVRSGTKFTCCGRIGMLKQIKQWIVDGEISNDEISVSDNNEETSTSLWDCVHPCALLVKYINEGSIPLDKEMIRTLDSYGYMTPEGKPDRESSDREIKRFGLRPE